MFRRLVCVAGAATLLGFGLACGSFGIELGSTIADASTEAGPLDGSSQDVDFAVGNDAGGDECADTSESAQTFCSKQPFCDSFDSNDGEVGKKWNDKETRNGGVIALGAGRGGRGFSSRVGADQGEARLVENITDPTAILHIDFDLVAPRPVFVDEHGWLDLIEVLPNGEDNPGNDIGGVGLEMNRDGFHVFVAGGPGGWTVSSFPTSCDWMHVHLAIRTRTNATGSVDIWVNGKSVFHMPNIRTWAGDDDHVKLPFVAVGGQSSGMEGPVEIRYDNVSISSAAGP